ncbi:hypothetical protein [Thermaurantiacus sp.]
MATAAQAPDRPLADRWGWRFAALLAAVATTHVVMSLGHSLMVQAALADLGISLGFGARISGISRDMLGLAPTLAPVIAGALVIAFAIAGLLRQRAGPFGRKIAFPLAGWAAMTVMLAAMRLSFGMTPLAGARTASGFLLMSLAGLAGGLVFAFLLRRRD